MQRVRTKALAAGIASVSVVALTCGSALSTAYPASTSGSGRANTGAAAYGAARPDGFAGRSVDGPRVAGDPLYVPSQYPTISAAILAASNGDTIYVAPGTYHDQLLVTGKYISIESTGNPSDTVITPPVPEPVVVWQDTPCNSCSTQPVFKGFTVKDGYSTASGQAGCITLAGGADITLDDIVVQNCSATTNGGGIWISNSNPVLDGVVVNHDMSDCIGGGIVVDGSSPSIIDTTVSDNLATAGGGMWIANGGYSVLVDDTFTGNTARGNTSHPCGGGEGGALGVINGVSGIIEDTTFSGNTAYYGGAVDLETMGASITIQSNNFTGNSVLLSPTDSQSGQGAALSVYNGTNGSIAGNDFTNNTAYGGGGGITVAQNSNVSISNNLVAHNTAQTQDGGGVYASGSGGNSSATLLDNCIMDNSAAVGGGVLVAGGASVTSLHDTIIDNFATRYSSTVNGNDFPWITGGIYVMKSASGASVNGDLIASNTGPQVYDEEGASGQTVGTYVGDDLYSPPASDGYLVAYGTGPVDEPANLDQVTNPPFRSSNLASFAPQLTSTNGCTTPAGSKSSAYGVSDPPAAAPEPVYRFFSSVLQVHFFTADINERNSIIATYPVSMYQYEGVGFYAYGSQVSGTVPVYRFYQVPWPHSHFYTAVKSEYQSLVSNTGYYWHYEGISFYVYPPATLAEVPVYRFRNVDNGAHFFTDNYGEYQYVKANLGYEWAYEFVAFDVPYGTPVPGQ